MCNFDLDKIYVQMVKFVLDPQTMEILRAMQIVEISRSCAIVFKIFVCYIFHLFPPVPGREILEKFYRKIRIQILN